MDPMALISALIPKAPGTPAAPVSARQLMLRTRLSKSFKTFGADANGRPITRQLKQWCMTDTDVQLDTVLLSDLSVKGLDQVIPEIGLKCCCVFLDVVVLFMFVLDVVVVVVVAVVIVAGLVHSCGCSCAMCSGVLRMSERSQIACFGYQAIVPTPSSGLVITFVRHETLE